MKNYLSFMLMLVFSGMIWGQTTNCGEVINDSFDTDGDLPDGWTEYNTSGRVTVSDGDMVFNYSSSIPSAYRELDSTTGEINFSMTVKCTRNYFKVQTDLLSSAGDYIASIMFGSNGVKNILYASELSSGEPDAYIELLDGNFTSNTEYTLSLVINTDDQTVDYYLDGVLKASSVSFLETASNLEKIDIQHLYMYGGSGYFYVDDVTVSKDDIVRSGLLTAIDDAQEHLDSITVGSDTGEYTQDVVDAFQDDIDEATAVYNNCDATQEEVDQAEEDLESAWSDFDDSRNWGSSDITITIDPDEVLCDKNEIWFGGNNTYNSSGQGLWDDENLRCYYDVIDLANYTGATGYRFPGGTMANLYHWKRAIGDVDERIDNLNSHGSAGPLSNEFGPDEFGLMMENTHMTNGVVVVSFNYDTPQDAADYVEYMNAEVGTNPNGGTDWAQVRSDNGHPDPYGVTYWEIGNELAGTWELSVCNYPTTGDDVRGGDDIQNGDVDIYVNGGSVTYTDQRAAMQTSWVETTCVVDGSASQVFYTKFAPVDLDQTFTLTINDVEWSRVDDFTASDSDDLHYTVDSETGKITFGDGNNGSAPSGGYNIMLDYTAGELYSFSDYYDAMKEVDSSIEVISCWEEAEFYREMAAISAPFDGVSKHYYPGGTADDGDEYKLIMKNAANYKNKIASHETYLSTYANSSLSGIDVKQHLTEFFGDKTIGVVTQLCLMWYDVINSYSDEVGNMMAHSYFKNDNTPMVNTSGGFVAAKGLPYHIFCHLHQDEFIEAAYSGGSYTYSSTTINNSYPTASVSENGRVITLVVPNMCDEDVLNATINFENYGFDGLTVTGKKWVAKAYDIYEENSSSEMDNVRIEGPVDIELSESVSETIQPFSVNIYQWIAEERIYLSDQEETVDGDDITKDEGFSDSGDLTVNGITYEKGIGVEAGTSVTYSLNGEYTSFVTEFGLDDAFTGAEVIVYVYVDDELMYQSDDISSNTPSPALNIDVTDANELRIETYSGLNSDGEGYIIFGDAYLLVDEADDVSSGLSDYAVSSNIQASPNPFYSSLLIQLPETESGKVELRSLGGNIVYSESFSNANQISISPSDLSAGLYMVTVKTENVIYVTKVLKQ
jgi:alpha-L-arabinofuranosidase